MFIFDFIRRIRTIRRINTILLVFFEQGFGWAIGRLGLSMHLPLRHRLAGKKKNAAGVSDLPRRLRMAFEKLGPVFVKFGQILSTRMDLLPPEYIRELENLQSRVQPFPHKDAVKIIEKSLGKSLHQLFAEFGFAPFAAASLGQVYKAKLKTGEAVAVKVQRPRAKEHIKLDTEVLLLLAHLAEKYMPWSKSYRLLETVDEFRRWTLNEIDYHKEATNCEIFGNLFKEDPNVYSPKVYWDYTGDSVLTLEYIDGLSLRKVVADKASHKVNKKLLCEHIINSYVKQFFKYGFFHADPHPGNIFVLGGNRLMFLDFGMVGFLDDRLAGLAGALFLALVQKDIESLVTLLLQIEQSYDDKPRDPAENQNTRVNLLRKELDQLVLQWSGVQNSQQVGFTELMFRMLNAAVKSGFAVPVDLVMLGKSVMTLDMVIKELDPELKLENWGKVMLEQITKERMRPRRIQGRLQNTALILDDLLKNLPESTAKIVGNLERAEFGQRLDPRELARYERLLDANSRLHSHGWLFALWAVVFLFLYWSKFNPLIFSIPLTSLVVAAGALLIVSFLISNIKKGA